MQSLLLDNIDNLSKEFNTYGDANVESGLKDFIEKMKLLKNTLQGEKNLQGTRIEFLFILVMHDVIIIITVHSQALRVN